MTKKVKLSLVLTAKENIEKEIKVDLGRINKLSLSKNSKQSDIQLELDKVKAKQQQLINLKLAIQEGNSKKHSGEKITNQEYIFKLSEIKRNLDFYSVLTTDDVEEIIKAYTKEKKEIEDKLEKFNVTTDVKVNVDKNLHIPILTE